MKKVLLLALVLGGLAFTSCSKKGDYTCTCTFSLLGVESTNETQFKDVKEEEAEEACEALEILSTCTLSED